MDSHLILVGNGCSQKTASRILNHCRLPGEACQARQALSASRASPLSSFASFNKLLRLLGFSASPEKEAFFRTLLQKVCRIRASRAPRLASQLH